MMMALAYAAICSVGNFLRGYATKNEKIDFFISKGAISTYLGVILGLLHGPAVGITVWLGFWLWSLQGWGEYFRAFHGNTAPPEKEVKWIDKIASKVFPHKETKKWAHRYGTLGMSLRGLHILPMFAGLAYLQASPAILAVGAVCGLMQGAVYGSPIARWLYNNKPGKWAVKSSEAIYGAVIGLSLGAVLL